MITNGEPRSVRYADGVTHSQWVCRTLRSADTAFVPITAGAATIGERRPSPVIPNQIAVTPKQLSIAPIILTPLLYFVLSSFHLSHSTINISCI